MKTAMHQAFIYGACTGGFLFVLSIVAALMS